MDRRTEMEKLRVRLWDRFLTLNTLYRVNMNFDQLWYSFLARELASDSPSEMVYEEFCDELEKKFDLRT